MSTIPDVTVTFDEFQSVNALTGISVGTELALQLKGTSWCYVMESATQPANDSVDGVLLTNLSYAYATARVKAGSVEVWVRASQEGRTSKLNVQEV